MLDCCDENPTLVTRLLNKNISSIFGLQAALEAYERLGQQQGKWPYKYFLWFTRVGADYRFPLRIRLLLFYSVTILDIYQN
ncbi:hypothetical protein GDO81_002061 [Engystomops pustulosus]|uniref:Uncharacterized protein n=1 Tax=Engystomops pustulosus TaxID=76066 RepID=A0AAV7DH40_ENGPU|nr:hypothetical protein GDO81_002061 [Engystomops pustulosus]